MLQTQYTLLLVTIISLRAVPSAAQSTQAAPKTIAHLNKFNADYRRAMVNGSVTMMMDYYVDTVRLMPEFQEVTVGKRNASLYYEAFLARFAVEEYHREATEILNLGTQVVEIGTFTTNILMKSTAQHYPLVGKYLNVWGKSESEELVLLTEAWNYDYPLEMEEQLKFEEVPRVVTALPPYVSVDSPVRFELAALNRLMETTVSQHNATQWSQFYADDASFLYSRHPKYVGRTALDSFFAEHVRELPIFEGLHIRNDRIDTLGDYVIVYASHVAVVKNGGFSGVFTGKDLAIWRRESDGSLKIFRHIAMYD